MNPQNGENHQPETGNSHHDKKRTQIMVPFLKFLRYNGGDKWGIPENTGGLQ